MRIIAVIPARYSSTRLPGKPLLDILGKPMIVRVYEKARAVSSLDEIIVATDDSRIVEAVEAVGGKAIMTAKDCESGSDRLREVAGKIDADVYINIQGDEPLLNPQAIERLCDVMRAPNAPPVATLAYPLSGRDEERVGDPNLVKVVFDTQGNALYFSRSPIPYVRDIGTPVTYFAHIGVYAYSREALEHFGSLPVSRLETIEKLEQLRLLQAGIDIRVVETEAFGPGVDTAEDLEKVRAIIGGSSIAEECSGEKKKKIRLIVTDVDGVLTDGSLIYGDEGEAYKRFNAKDGLGVKIAQKNGLQIAVLSGRDCPALRRRIDDLGIGVSRLGRLEKSQALREILDECGCTKEECVFLGDDVTDLAGFSGSAMGIAVADAHHEVRKKAHYVLRTPGGQGALRELIDLLLGGQL